MLENQTTFRVQHLQLNSSNLEVFLCRKGHNTLSPCSGRAALPTAPPLPIVGSNGNLRYCGSSDGVPGTDGWLGVAGWGLPMISTVAVAGACFKKGGACMLLLNYTSEHSQHLSVLTGCHLKRVSEYLIRLC